MPLKKLFLSVLFVSLCLGGNGFQAMAVPELSVQSPYAGLRHAKVLATCYYSHLWSDTGRYRQVSKNGKRIGEFVACNFLPAGSIIMIPQLFKTTKLEVADTFGGSGVGYWQGKRYWKIDILRDKNEWIDDLDGPLEMYVVKYNHQGAVKNEQVRKNCAKFLRESLRP